MKNEYRFCVWDLDVLDDKKYQALEVEKFDKMTEVSFFTGDELTENLPVINFIGQKSKKIADYPQTLSGYPLFSSRLREILAELKINNIQYLDSNIISTKKETISSDYKIGNIIGRYKCMDLDESEYAKIYPEYSLVRGLKKLVIDESKISEDVQLFRLGELGTVILVRKEIRDELIKRGVSGVTFFDIEEYKRP